MQNIIKIMSLFVLFSLSIQAKSLRIEPEVLAQYLGEYTILDTREESAYKEGHIQGALNFPILLTFENLKENGRIVTPSKFQTIARNLGLNKNSKIVIYENSSFFDAARLFWSLEAYGFSDVKLLDSNYVGWVKSGYPTSKEIPRVKKSNYISTINNKRLATKFSTQIAMRNPNQIIIDARSQKGYEGVVSSAKRFGHIPKALNIPASHNIQTLDNGTKKLYNNEELKELYSNLDKSKKVILYCAVGKISATNYFALRELGFDVSNYDASWKEWGNEFSLPIVGPKNKR